MLPTADTSQISVILERVKTIQDDVSEIKTGVKETGERVRAMEISYSATCEKVASQGLDIIALDKKVDDRKTVDNWWSGINSFFVIIAGIIGAKSP